uniref:Exosome complex component N-terminal domain-containing protein n=1 Tax=Hyaloperonospora arabidopsidis (strain Emoy2) TaxID=559515 RepID=M4B8D7_HYAAE
MNVAVPGQRLVTAAEKKLTAGKGAYERDGAIFASICGQWSVSQNVVEVTRANKTVASALVLRLGDIVIGRVTKLTTRQVMVDILCVNKETVFHEPFPGTIRLEDVRSHDIDKLVIEEVFLPDVLVKAVVLSFGDTRSYFLSTAKPGLGVVRQPIEQKSQVTETETEERAALY